MAHLCFANITNRACVNRRQPIPNTWVRPTPMQDTFNRGHLFSTLRRGTFRHHRFLIPTQAASDLAKGRCLARERHQVVVSSHWINFLLGTLLLGRRLGSVRAVA